MTIELTTSAAAHALADYLRRCGCTVFMSEGVLDVALGAMNPELEPRSVEEA